MERYRFNGPLERLGYAVVLLKDQRCKLKAAPRCPENDRALRANRAKLEATVAARNQVARQLIEHPPPSAPPAPSAPSPRPLTLETATSAMPPLPSRPHMLNSATSGLPPLPPKPRTLNSATSALPNTQAQNRFDAEVALLKAKLQNRNAEAARLRNRGSDLEKALSSRNANVRDRNAKLRNQGAQLEQALQNRLQVHAGQIQGNRNAAQLIADKDRQLLKAQAEMQAVATQLTTLQAQLAEAKAYQNAMVAQNLISRQERDSNLQRITQECAERVQALEARLEAPVQPIISESAEPEPEVARNLAQEAWNAAQRLVKAKGPVANTNSNKSWYTNLFDIIGDGRLTDGRKQRIRPKYPEIKLRLAQLLGRIFVNVIINRHEPSAAVQRPQDAYLALLKTTRPPAILPAGNPADGVSVQGTRYGSFYTVTDLGNNGSVEQSYAAKAGGDALSVLDIAKTALDGGSVTIFGYGFSGSGKTFALLGDGSSVGYMPLILADLNDVGASIKPVRFFELYGGIDVPALTQRRNLSTEEAIRYSVQEYPVEAGIWGAQGCMERRHTEKTINNPFSSRGHLFLVFEVRLGVSTGYITFVDMAGMEDSRISLQSAVDIYDSHRARKMSEATKNEILFSTCRAIDYYASPAGSRKVTPNMIWTDTNSIGSTISPEVKAILSGSVLTPQGKVKIIHDLNLRSTIPEGFYVTQTLNDLKFFFRTRAGLPTKAVKLPDGQWTTKTTNRYNKFTTFVDYTTFDIKAPLPFRPGLAGLDEFIQTTARDQDPTGMITLMRVLGNLGSEPGSEAYSMVAVINDLVPYKPLEAAIDTLQFAKDVSV